MNASAPSPSAKAAATIQGSFLVARASACSGTSVPLSGGASSEIRASPMACSRCRRSLVKQRRNSVETSAGVPFGNAFQSGSSLSTEANVSDADSPVNARLPVSIS